MENNYYDVTTGKQSKFSLLQKMYLELEKIITPRLLDDFCGYNEETQSFDIVLAIKEIIEAKEQECEELKKGVIKQCPNCGEQYLNQIGAELYEECEALKKQLEQQEALTETYKTCYRGKHNDVKDELIRLKQALDEIEECCKQACRLRCTNDCLGTRKHCGYGAVLDIIDKAKEK
mgnify:CR=1 FL=1